MAKESGGMYTRKESKREREVGRERREECEERV
jgi:hypothetical protein